VIAIQVIHGLSSSPKFKDELKGSWIVLMEGGVGAFTTGAGLSQSSSIATVG
jgi:hypothetical protein